MAYSPDQPRSEDGRWSSGGGTDVGVRRSEASRRALGPAMQEQARSGRGRFVSGGIGKSQRRAEITALNTRLDARNRSRTFDFGPAARYMENTPAPAHQTGVETATAGKTLAQVSAEGTNPAMPQPKLGGQS